MRHARHLKQITTHSCLSKKSRRRMPSVWRKNISWQQTEVLLVVLELNWLDEEVLAHLG